MIHPAKPEDRILLVLQYWKGDIKQAMTLARFIADIQPGLSEVADFLFVARFDCPHDTDTIKYVSKKFRTYHHTSKRRGTGWPNGCNDLWFGAMEWVQSMIEAKKVPAYKAVLTFESDCVPLAANWLNQLSNAWDDAVAKSPTFVLGAYLTAPGPHINGNAMFSCHPAFLHWLVRKVGGAPPNAGWDYVLYKDFRRWGAANLPGLKSYWATKTFSEEGFNREIAEGTFFLHGVKDDSLLRMARKKFLP
jgi:hypothetical protein